jgi:hypothetical protein
VQLVEAIFNEYANERSGVDRDVSDNTAKVEELAIYFTITAHRGILMYVRKKELSFIPSLAINIDTSVNTTFTDDKLNAAKLALRLLTCTL